MKNQFMFGGMRTTLVAFFLSVVGFWTQGNAQVGHELVNGSPWMAGSYVINPAGFANKEANPGARSGAAVAYYEGKLFLFGGKTLPSKYPAGPQDATNDLWQYNPLYQAWQKLSNHYFYWGGTGSCGPDYGLPSGPLYTNGEAPAPGAGALMAGYNGGLFIIGADERCWRFDMFYRRWQEAGSTNQPKFRSGMVGWVHNNQWFVLGAKAGTDACMVSKADLWVLDFATMTWSMRKAAGSCDNLPDYGTKGLAADANHPGERLRAAATIYNGEAYLFGGEGYGINGKGMLNDLWIYNFNSNQWRWVGGSQQVNALAVKGPKESFDAGYEPAARAGAALFANNGRIYVQGGQHTDSSSLYDMWVYDTLLKQWSLWRADTLHHRSGVFGAPKQSGATLYPGSKQDMAYWTLNNKFYVLGGNGIDSTGLPTITSDVWQYDPSIGEWAWMWGDANQQMRGRYGTKSIWSSSNIPGPRKDAVSWQWLRRFYLFGGYGYDSKGKLGLLNDLWEMDPESRQWRWLSGSDTCNAPTVTSGPQAHPGAREQSIKWIHLGKLWLMGGNGVGAQQQKGMLSDLWQYDPMLQTWTHQGGTLATGYEGSFGDSAVFATDNWPPARLLPGMWAQRGKLYLYGDDHRSDLWEYDMTKTQWRWLAGEKEIGVNYTIGTNHITWPSPGSSYIGRAFWQLGRTLVFSHRNVVNISWAYDVDSLKWKILNYEAIMGDDGSRNLEHRNYGIVQMGNSLAYYGGYGTNRRYMGCLNLDYVGANFVDEFTISSTGNYYRTAATRSGILDPEIMYNGNTDLLQQNLGGRSWMAAWWLPGSMYLFGGEGIDAAQRVGLLGDTWRIELRQRIPPAASSETFWIPDVHETPDIATASPSIVATVWPAGTHEVKGSLDASLKVWDSAIAYGSKLVLRRGYDFQYAQNTTTATARITLYVSQSDFDDFNSRAGALLLPVAGSDAGGKARLRVSLLGGASADSSGLPGTYPGPETLIDPADAAIVWNGVHNRWEISFDATGSGGFFVHAYDKPLPVTLFTLSATQRNEEVELFWNIESSAAVRAFEIEWSANGRQWEKCYTQHMANPIMKGSFEYSDQINATRLQAQILHYRIAAVQLDGSIVYSPVRQVKLPAALSVRVLANPVSDAVMLEFIVTEPIPAQLTLMDMTGRVLKQEQLHLSAGTRLWRWPVGQLAVGQYQIIVSMAGRQMAPLRLQKQ